MLFKVCNALMGMGFNMLGEGQSAETIISSVGDKVKTIAATIINYIFAFAGLAAVVYAVYLAIVFFRADTAEKREEAKKRLIYAVLGVVVCIAVILIINFAISNINVWTGESLTKTNSNN